MVELPAYERSIPTSRASELSESVSMSIRSAMGIDVVDMSPAMPVYVAKDKKNRQRAFGCGKGAHSQLSAFGECIEHLHMWHTSEELIKNSKCMAVEELFQEDTLIRVGNTFAPPRLPIRAMPYRSLDGEAIAYLPASLVSMHYLSKKRAFTAFETFYSRYASSSGTAFGFCFEDALLHAVLEVIERHEISLLYLDLLGNVDSRRPYSLIDDYGFQQQISDVVDDLSQTTNAESIRTVLKRSDLGPFFSFTVMSIMQHGKPKRIWGAGASLYRDLAIYRSVTECQQMAQSKEPTGEDQIAIFAERYPKLKLVADVEIDQLDLQKTSLKALPIRRKPVAKQLSELHRHLRATNRAVLHFRHQSADPRYHVISAYVTETEKFFGILFGIPTLPIKHLKKYDPRAHGKC